LTGLIHFCRIAQLSRVAPPPALASSTPWRLHAPTEKPLAAGEPCMFDLHSMFKLGLGDHSHNYLIAPASKRQRRHAPCCR